MAESERAGVMESSLVNDKDKIRTLYQNYWQHMIDKDADSLRRIMADDYVLIHMTGVRQSKEEFL